MNKEEAIQHFMDVFVATKKASKLLELEKYYRTHQEELVIGFLNSFREICQLIRRQQEEEQKGKIAYITYSMLRSELLANRGVCIIEAFDHRWYLDKEKCVSHYDASWAFQFLHELMRELEPERKRYAGLIHAADMDQIKLAEAVHFFRHVSSLAIHAVSQAIELDEYIAIEKHDGLEVRIGEYFDISEMIYKEQSA
ncbi:hypothetical protein [Paenibacillus dendritiformis]|uniref:hypothetical protein n=1 Tax=Paenibacillus dendritiformis TaxID=130049 RepID=UPI000DA96BD9|nr:hypothetical protein [Paenibacillus dendritiformis]PZM61938.1 hypothetical protein DOE73_29995 [Paenibacillus dendritiformis]